MNFDRIRVPISPDARFILLRRNQHHPVTLEHFARQNRGWQTVSTNGSDRHICDKAFIAAAMRRGKWINAPALIGSNNPALAIRSNVAGILGD